jgi:hypothetical protein
MRYKSSLQTGAIQALKQSILTPVETSKSAFVSLNTGHAQPIQAASAPVDTGINTATVTIAGAAVVSTTIIGSCNVAAARRSARAAERSADAATRSSIATQRAANAAEESANLAQRRLEYDQNEAERKRRCGAQQESSDSQSDESDEESGDQQVGNPCGRGDTTSSSRSINHTVLPAAFLLAFPDVPTSPPGHPKRFAPNTNMRRYEENQRLERELEGRLQELRRDYMTERERRP